MKTVPFSNFSLGLLSMIIILFLSCQKSESDDPQSIDELEGTPNQTDYGKPYLAHFHTYDHNEKKIKFTVVTDNHVDACNAMLYAENTDRNRWVIDAINQDNSDGKVHFIVQLGDGIQTTNLQNLVAFRQLWENDYPGYNGGAIAGASDTDYDAYSGNSRIKLPVYLSLGNHGIPDSPDGWNYQRDYVSKRFKNAAGLLTYYEHAWSTYMWRSGRYIFLHFGLWAGSHAYQSNTNIDHAKIEWVKSKLQEYLPDSTFGLIVLQHYGWDNFSTNGNWWSKEMRDITLNILCRRDSTHQPCNPYNVIAIFTGHKHEQQYLKIHAGVDKTGKEVIFDNIVFDDAGGDPVHGYSHVYLDEDTMYIHYHKHYCDCCSEWFYWGKKIKVLN